MPYRIDLPDVPDAALDRLLDLGALDVERTAHGLAAIVPDTVAPAAIEAALGTSGARVSPAVGRDDDSVWTLSLRPVRTRRLTIVPVADRGDREATPRGTVLAASRGAALAVPHGAALAASRGTVLIADTPAFGSGLHATTGLCLDAIDDIMAVAPVSRMLDVGTGSGILALAAVALGVRRVVAVDLDPRALDAAARNVTINGVTTSIALVHGGVDAVRGTWPLVAANIRAAELMAMATLLVRRVASGGRLLLSGIPRGVQDDVTRVYERLGMVVAESREREGWSAVLLRATW